MKWARNPTTFTPTSGTNVQITGATVTFTLASPGVAFVQSIVSVGAAGDTEIQPSIFLDGVLYYNQNTPAATVASGRAVQRTASTMVNIPAGTHTLGAGVLVAGSSGYSVIGGAGSITAMVFGNVTA